MVALRKSTTRPRLSGHYAGVYLRFRDGVAANAATSQVIFTEYRQEKKGDPMKMTTQGKEYAVWAKVNGKWLYKKRQIAGGSEPPADWKE